MIGQKLDADDDLLPLAPLPPEAARESEGALPTEIGGRKGPDPTRYGDWETNSRCIDF